MKIKSRAFVSIFFAMALAGLGAIQFYGSEALAQSSYFSSRGCTNCHSAPTASTCAGCHQHSGTLSASKNKTTSYAPGETVTITLSASGARSGWIGARLYDQTGAEIARSTGNQSGMGGAATFPATLSAPAPAAAGTYTWRMAYFGNLNGTGTGDVHGEKSVNVSLTVAAPVDATAPVVGVFTLPTTSTSLTVSVSSFTATDNVAVTGYMVTTSATAPLASAAGWSATAPASVTAPAPGSVTFFAWAKDAAGNVSASKSATVNITLPDTTAPVVGAFTLPATSTSLTVPVSSFTATDNVAVTGYMVTTSATAPLASAAGWSATPPASATAPAEGSVTFFAWAKDAAGNVSLSKSASVSITIPDTTAPVVDAFTLPATSTSLTVSVSSFTATDNVGVTGYMVTTSSTAPLATAAGWSATAPASVTAPAPGSVTFFAWAKDAAGNVSASQSATVIITLPDTTVPVVNAFTLPSTSTSLIISVSSFTATDNVGVTGYMVTTSLSAPLASAAGWSATAPASVTAPDAGNVTFFAWAKDAAGNVSSSKSASVNISAETIPPTMTVSTLANGAVTNNATLNVSGTASDASGIASVTVNGAAVTVAADGSFTTALTLVSGVNIITTVATDTVGNQTSDTRTINLDLSGPLLTISSPADNSKISQTFVDVTGTVSENSNVTVNGGGAAMNGLNFSATVNLAEGINTIDITATDLAGNTTNLKRSVTSDQTLPSLAVTVPAQDITSTSASNTISGTVSDALTAVTVTITADGMTYTPAVADGSFTQDVTLSVSNTYPVVVIATDEAGNQVSVTRNIIYTQPATGDLSGDSTTNVQDALMALQLAVGAMPMDNAYLAQGDVAPYVNGQSQPDGKIDIADALVILKMAVGLLPSI